jgi:hypothetical protein
MKQENHAIPEKWRITDDSRCRIASTRQIPVDAFPLSTLPARPIDFGESLSAESPQNSA